MNFVGKNIQFIFKRFLAEEAKDQFKKLKRQYKKSTEMI